MSCPNGSVPTVNYVLNTHVRKGDYDWIQLRGWYRSLSSAAPAGWFTADIDEARNRLAFQFTSAADLEAFRAAAQRLGVPAGALLLSIGTPPRVTVGPWP